MHDIVFSSSFDLGTYNWDKFSFCKNLGLCFTDGNILNKSENAKMMQAS